MKKTILLLCCLFVGIMLQAEMYHNDEFNFSFDLPSDARIFKINEDKLTNSALFGVTRADEPVISIMCFKRDESYKIKYDDYRKFLLSDGSIILEDRPFYDLLRQDIAYITTDNMYEKVLLKANSYITIGADYPLSADAEYVISTFDNHRTWRGDWWRFNSNCHWLIRLLFFTLIALFGMLSRGRKYSWVFLCLSVLMFAIEFVCLWQSKAVLAIVFSATMLVWLVMLSQNKKLIWLVDSIFGA